MLYYRPGTSKPMARVPEVAHTIPVACEKIKFDNSYLDKIKFSLL